MTLCSRASDMNRPGPKSCQGRHRTIRPRSLSLACFGMFAAPLPEGFAASAHQSNHPWIACGVGGWLLDQLSYCFCDLELRCGDSGFHGLFDLFLHRVVDSGLDVLFHDVVKAALVCLIAASFAAIIDFGA